MIPGVEDIKRNKAYYKRRLEIILSYLDIKDKSILDLGCGEMILFELVKDKIKNYIGIDKYKYVNSANLVIGDISDHKILESHPADCNFLVGVLDHLSLETKALVMQTLKNEVRNLIVISQRNPKAFINLFFHNLSQAIIVEDYFINRKVKQLDLLKIPFSQFVMDLTTKNRFLKLFATEKIYLISD